jgi:hypothetical protein
LSSLRFAKGSTAIDLATALVDPLGFVGAVYRPRKNKLIESAPASTTT